MLSNLVIGLVKGAFAAERAIGSGLRITGEVLVVAGEWLEEDAGHKSEALDKFLAEERPVQKGVKAAAPEPFVIPEDIIQKMDVAAQVVADKINAINALAKKEA